MEYRPLSLRLRPQNFRQIIGQDLIVKTIQSSIMHDKLSVAYLLTGLRGTGKTSLARIISKALNCQNLKDNEPCNECVACNEIRASICPDVIEIDAASNRGIENIREIQQNIKFLPHYCKVKVYIIDEAHMLTNEAFASLLKTLEEPKLGTKFILATTNPQKIPETILSRCLRFDLRLISLKTIEGFLQEVAKNEGLNLELDLIAKLALKSGGSMRDALMALETLLNLDLDELSLEDLSQILGIGDFKAVLNIVSYAFKAEIEKALFDLQVLYQKGVPINQLVADFLKVMRCLAFAKEPNIKPSDIRDLIAEDALIIWQMAKDITISKIHQAFDLFIDVETKSYKTMSGNWLLELAIIKLSHLEDLSNIEDLMLKLTSSELKDSQPNSLKTSKKRDQEILKEESTNQALLKSDLLESDINKEDYQDSLVVDNKSSESPSSNLTEDIDSLNGNMLALEKEDSESTLVKDKAQDSPQSKNPQVSDQLDVVIPQSKTSIKSDTWVDFVNSSLTDIKSDKLKTLLTDLVPISMDDLELVVSKKINFVLKTLSSKENEIIKEQLLKFFNRPLKLKITDLKEEQTANKSYTQIQANLLKAKQKDVLKEISQTDIIIKLKKQLPGEIKDIELH